MKSFLKKKDEKRLFHRKRQQTYAYKAREKFLKEKRKKEAIEKEKLSKKRNHTYKDEAKTTKKKKISHVTDILAIETVVFHEFKIEGGRKWYRGVVTNVITARGKDEGKTFYNILFDDGQPGKRMSPSVLVTEVPPRDTQWEGNKNLIGD